MIPKKHEIQVRIKGSSSLLTPIKRKLRSECIGNFNPIFCTYKGKMNTQGAAALLQSLKNPCDPLPTHGKGRRNKKIALPTFTEREKEVITHIASSLTNREIADTLLISVKTVEKHRQNLMDKFNLRNTAAITRYAIAHRLIKLEKYA